MSVIKPQFIILKVVNIEYCFVNSLSVFIIYPDSVETDAVFESLPFSDDSITLKESSNRNNAGISYQTEIQFEYLSYNSNNTSELQKLLKQKLILRLTTDTGHKIIVGAPDYPVRLSANRNWKSYQFRNELTAKCNSVYPLLPFVAFSG
jgi:hypothetical protein